MESSSPTRLPSIVSSKPFYISPHHKPNPFRYRHILDTSHRSPPLPFQSKINNSGISVHEKSKQKGNSKLELLRYYIEGAMERERSKRDEGLRRRREEEERELERKREKVRQMRQRHKAVMGQMGQYLRAMRKYYWNREVCLCGCGEEKHKEKESMRENKKEDVEGKQNENNEVIQNKDAKIKEKKPLYRLNNLSHFRHTDFVIPTSIDGHSFTKILPRYPLLNASTNTNQHSRLTHNPLSPTQSPSTSLLYPHSNNYNPPDLLEITPELEQTANTYFTLLSSLERNVKTHLSSSKGINRLLEQLCKDDQKNNVINSIHSSSTKPSSKSKLKSKPNINNNTKKPKFDLKTPDLKVSIFRVLSLTKSNWQDIFKNIIVVKQMQKRLNKIAKEKGCEIKYTEEEKTRKSMVDAMYEQLKGNRQYMAHVEREIRVKGMEKEIMERVSEEQREQSQQQQEQERLIDLPSATTIKKQPLQLPSKSLLPLFTPITPIPQLPQPYYPSSKPEPTNYYAQGKKAQIHQQMQSIIQQFMQNQSLIKNRKANRGPVPPRQTLLQSLGIDHMVQKRNSSKNVTDLSFYDAGKERRSTMVPTMKELAKRSVKLGEIRKGMKEVKGKVKKKRKEKEEEKVQKRVETPEFIQQQKQIPPQQLSPPQHRPKFHPNPNFLSSLYTNISFPTSQPPISTLNPLYQKTSIFSDQRQQLYSKIRSLKLKKRIHDTSTNRTSQYFDELNGHENLGIIKTRLFELFKHDDWNNFQKEAVEFWEGQDKMDENLEKLEIIKIEQLENKIENNWISDLDFNINVQQVDVLDLVINEKIKNNMFGTEGERWEDLAEFRVEKTMSNYEFEGQKKRLRMFMVEGSYIRNRRMDGNDGEIGVKEIR